MWNCPGLGRLFVLGLLRGFRGVRVAAGGLRAGVLLARFLVARGVTRLVAFFVGGTGVEV